MLRRRLKQDDQGEIQAAVEDIQQAVQAAAQQIYAKAGMGDQAGPADEGLDPDSADATATPETGAADEDVVEADYEIVEESDEK